tara:strand:+ start:27 stop:194 length:168 start_codon:yes stop_codon:yes gene_type:complete
MKEEAVYQNNEFLGWVNNKTYEGSNSLKKLVSVECEFAPNYYRTIYIDNGDIEIK